MLPPPRAYVSFDYAHDLPAKNVLVAQSLNPGWPVAIAGWSPTPGDKEGAAHARAQICQADIVIVLCGRHTHAAAGVARDVEIAREEGVRCCLLRARKRGIVRRPPGTTWLADTIYPWTPLGFGLMSRERSFSEAFWPL